MKGYMKRGLIVSLMIMFMFEIIPVKLLPLYFISYAKTSEKTYSDLEINNIEETDELQKDNEDILDNFNEVGVIKNLESDFEIDENGVLVAYHGEGGKVVVPDGVNRIGGGVFRGCASLTELILPKGLTSIGAYAFDDCNNLIKLELPEELTSIELRAFSSCNSLIELILPKGLTSIGADAFYYCSSLTKLTLPEGLTSIGSSAFRGCSSLTKLILPEGLTSIRSSAFRGCSSLTELILPEGLTVIEHAAFAYCSGLTELVLPKGLTSIGECAFQECESLTNVIFPEGLISIEGSAFLGCKSLLELIFPEGLMSIGDSAFCYCSSLTNVIFPESLRIIEDDAFLGCDSLTEVIFPKGLTSIGKVAFYSCDSLTEVIFPESLTSIGQNAFYGCSSLTEVILPSKLTNIESEVFRACNNLTKLILPESLTNIGYGAFSGCSSLTELVLPESLTSIESSAFSGCSSLIKLILPENITSIEDSTFSQCINLTELILPKGLITIGSGAFTNCRNLTGLILPEGLTSIGYIAFSNCSSLTISCYAGSYAETYAKENNIPYQLVSTPIIPDTPGDKSSLQWNFIAIGDGIQRCTVGIVECITCCIVDDNGKKIKEVDSNLDWSSSNNDVLHFCGSYFDESTGDYYGYFKLLKPGIATVTVQNGNGEFIERDIESILNVTISFDKVNHSFGYKDGKYTFTKVTEKVTIFNSYVSIPTVLPASPNENLQSKLKDIYAYAEGIEIDKNASGFPLGELVFSLDGKGPLSFDQNEQTISHSIMTDIIVPFGGKQTIEVNIYPNSAYIMSERIRNNYISIKCEVRHGKETIHETSNTYKIINYDIPIQATEKPSAEATLSNVANEQIKELIKVSSKQQLIVQPLGSLFTKSQCEQLNVVLAQWICVVTDPNIDTEIKKMLFESYNEKNNKIESSIIIPVVINNRQYPNKGTRKIKFSMEYDDIGGGLNSFLNQFFTGNNISASTNHIKWELLDKANMNKLNTYSGTLAFLTKVDLQTLQDSMKKAAEQAKKDMKEALKKDTKLYSSAIDDLLDSLEKDPEDYITPYTIAITKNTIKAIVWKEEPKYWDAIKEGTKKIISKKITIKCPVDVYLYYNDELKGIIENNQIDLSCETYNVGSYMSIDGDTKSIYLPDEAFSIKLVGNDTGSMDYSVEEYEEGENITLIRTVYFDNLSLEKGKVYTGNLEEGAGKDKSVYALYTDGKIVEPDYDTALGDEIIDKPATDADHKDDNSSNNGNHSNINTDRNDSDNNDSSEENKSDKIVSKDSKNTGSWVKDDIGWWYQNIDNSYPANQWQFINGKWYFFNKAGYMVTGWILSNNKWYYLGADGAMLENSWLFYKNQWYFLKGGNGDMATGWILWKNQWYYLNKDGFMKTGWLLEKNIWYYLNQNGDMAIDCTTPDGYRVNQKGEWIP